VPDFLTEKRQEIDSRLKELKPRVDEYNRLVAAAQALGSVPAARGSAATPRRRGPGRRPAATSEATVAPSRRGRRKGSGARGTEALSYVTEQPGITIPELAGKMGIQQNYLYRVLPSLEEEGRVEKKGRGWHPKAA
jgi:hypothetical protein